MASLIVSTLTSTVATSHLEVPTGIAKTNDFRSLQNHAATNQLITNTSAYTAVDWTRLKGYIIPSDDADLTSGIWTQGWRLFHPATDRYWWLCKQCHLSKRTRGNTLKEVVYLADRTTSGPIQHLRTVHKIDTSGKSTEKKRKRCLDDYCRQGGYDELAEVDNTLAAAFEQHHFKALFYDWVIANNVPFEQLDTPSFHHLLTYLNPRCERHIPSSSTASRTVAILYDKTLGTVTETLQSAITKINVSFDLWTSKNKLALLGLCAHFINNTGNSITSLLALPRQKGRHTGFNVAETVSDIIASFGLQERIGYFTTDNASANEKTLTYLANEHGFERNTRWVRCCGHIFNLVGQAALFGSDSQAFAKEIEDVTIEELELRQWRRKGPIGKLHNIVYWVNRSPQRCERFESLQRRLIAPTRPDGKKETYELVKDVETRWNSFYYSAERACYLRPAIDELLEEEASEYDRYTRKCTASNRPVKRQPPPILKDTLSTDDWAVITRYVEILKPLKDATMALEGHIGGRFGAIWRVLPQYEKILLHFEGLVNQYPINESLRYQNHLQISPLTPATPLPSAAYPPCQTPPSPRSITSALISSLPGKSLMDITINLMIRLCMWLLSSYTLV